MIDRDRQILFSPWQVRIVKNFLKMLPKAASQGQNLEARDWLVYFSCGKLAYSGLFTSLCLWISLRALYKRFVKKSSQRQTHIPDTKVCVMVQTRFSLTKLKVNVSKNQTKSKISSKSAKTSKLFTLRQQMTRIGLVSRGPFLEATGNYRAR